MLLLAMNDGPSFEGPLLAQMIASLAASVERAAVGAGLELKAHPHMLRHACGYALANKGHDTRAIQGWLGHRSITSTAVYTALAPGRFKTIRISPSIVAGSHVYRSD